MGGVLFVTSHHSSGRTKKKTSTRLKACVRLAEGLIRTRGWLESLRAMNTFSSGARTNCIVFAANSAIHSSIELSVTASYALLNNAMRMFRSTGMVSGSNSYQSGQRRTDHHYKSIDVV